MKRPSISDLATAAGVSIATVNRLLHGTAKVRPDTIEAITRAAERIGFYGLGALRSRETEARPRYRLGFVLQQSSREIYRQFGQGLTEAARLHPRARVEAEICFVDELTPDAFCAALSDLAQRCQALAIVCADHPQVSQTIAALRDQGVPVVTYITDLSAPARAGYVGTDNWKLGRTAGFFLAAMASRPGKVATFIGNHRYQCQDISDASFRSYFREHAAGMPVLDPVLTHEDPATAHRMVGQLLAGEPDLVGLYVIGGGVSGVLRALEDCLPARRREIRMVCRDVGAEARRGLSAGLISAALCHPIAEISAELIATMIQTLRQEGQPAMIQNIVPFRILTPENV